MWLREIFETINDYPWTTFFFVIIVCIFLKEAQGFVKIDINKK